MYNINLYSTYLIKELEVLRKKFKFKIFVNYSLKFVNLIII